jgi:hypothetical protein
MIKQNNVFWKIWSFTLSSCKNIWLDKLVLRHCPRVNFPFQSNPIEHVLPTMVQKTMDLHVQPSFVTITTFFASFDLWMSRGGANIFALVINYLDENYIP